MADFTTEKTWSVGDTLAAADMNTYVRDNVQNLYDNSMLLIESVTLSSDTADVTFDSISGDFNHLCVKFLTRSDQESSKMLYMTFNGSADTDLYSIQNHYGENTGTGARRRTGDGRLLYSAEMPTSTDPAAATAGTIDVLGYAQTTFYKIITGVMTTMPTFRSVNTGGIWKSTDAITSISLYPGEGSFASGSIFSLYGYR